MIVLGGCDASVPRFEPIRYRLFAEVETPTGIKSGFSVIEVSLERSLRGSRVTGEAVPVDLAPGKTLFVVLRSRDDVDWAVNAINYFPATSNYLPGEKGHEGAVRRTERALDAKREDRSAYPVWLPNNGSRGSAKKLGSPDTPYLVWFRNVRDPKTVEKLDPDDLAKKFGHGFRLKKMMVQITDEPVTSAIRGRLVWLGRYPEPSLGVIPGGGVAKPTIAQELTHGDFRKG